MDLVSLKSSTQDALDDVRCLLSSIPTAHHRTQLISARSSSGRRTRALAALGHLLALACVPRDALGELDELMQIQDTFECNGDQEIDLSLLESHLSQSLSLLQGFALNHRSSKNFMGRKYALQTQISIDNSKVLLDLLVTCNNLPPFKSSAGRSNDGTRLEEQTRPPALLSSVVLDTLLCILVDSSASLRAFEDCDGVQVVVKILKTAGTPREVRMKCLEFLYFYLMDETASISPQNEAYRKELFPANQTPPSPSKREAVPGSPTKTTLSTPSHARPSTRPSSPTKSKAKPFPPTRLPSSSSSKTWGSISSMSSGLSISTRSTTPESTEPEKVVPPVPKTPSKSHASQTDRSAVSGRVPMCPPVILRNDVDIDYVPISPKKPKMARVGAGNMPGMASKVRELRDLSTGSKASGTPSKGVSDTPGKYHRAREASSEGGENLPIGEAGSAIRSSDEKKEILGSMLGNVDALVEGVRKAGVWGLG
ncbi:hypothetical protein HWV62_32313 [Athelia sp. TMB]|nr:hypothetical protein HWV62_32313 [Athelia sp. TMB]